MSQTVKLLDEDHEEQSYIVPNGFRVPKAGGSGMATAYFAEGTLQISENGTYDVHDKLSVLVDVATGIVTADSKDVNFYDPYGNIIYSYSAYEFLALSEFPATPDGEGHQYRWAGSISAAKQYVTAYGMLDIGCYANYWPDDTLNGYLEIEIELVEGRLSPTLRIGVEGSATVSFGDGTTTTISGNSSSTAISVPHTYASPGIYSVKVTGTRAPTTIGIVGNSNAGSLLFGGANGAYSGIVRSIFRNNLAGPDSSYAFSSLYALKHMIGSPVTTHSNGGAAITSVFLSCFSLEHVYLTSAGDYAFYNCGALLSVCFSLSVNAIGSSAFHYCRRLRRISLPDAVTTIGNAAFEYCYALSRVSFGNSLTSIGAYAFCYCYGISNITLPATLTTIGNSAFAYCYSMKEIHFRSATPPMAGSAAFASLPTDCIIYVPAGSLSAYTGATNYPRSSTYTYREE